MLLCMPLTNKVSSSSNIKLSLVSDLIANITTYSSSSSSSATVQGSVSLLHYRTLEVRPGIIS